MSTKFDVSISPDLEQSILEWGEDDQDDVIALFEALEEEGFDIIVAASLWGHEWPAVDFIEPGEIPDMLWATVFVGSHGSAHKVRVTCPNGKIVVDSG